MIALHASLLARRTGKPVRMIYDRHEDLSATTKRHPAVIHHRTGLTRDGRIVAQDIDLVLDGGAYTTLTPGRAVAGDDPRRRPVRRRQRPDPVARGRHEHAAQRRVPRVRGAAVGVRRRDAGQPGGRGPRDVAARAPPPERLPAGRRDADAAGARVRRRRARGARAGRRGVAVRAGPRPDRRGARRAGPRAPGRPAASASRWPGTAPGSRAPARRRWAPSRASSSPPTAGSGS